MYSEISVQIISLIYVLVLSLVYFLKRKYNFLESKIYKLLLVFTSITLILDIGSMFIIEEKILDLQQKKKIVADNVMEGHSEQVLSKLSEKEMRDLLTMDMK